MINYFKNLFNRLRRAFNSAPRFKNILDWYDNYAKDAIGVELTTEQRLILATYYGLELTKEQQEILDSWQAAGKATVQVGQPYKDLVVEAGRRSGKDTLLFLICFYEFEKLCRNRPTGQPKKTDILVVHHNSDHCRHMLSHMASSLPYTFKKVLEPSGNITERQLSYDGISIKTSSYQNALKTLEGCSGLHMIMLNECAGYKEALPIWIKCAMRSNKRVAFSTAWYKNDCIERLFELSKTSAFMAGFKLPSWDLNPKCAGRDNPVVDSFYDSNPELAKTQFEGIR